MREYLTQQGRRAYRSVWLAGEFVLAAGGWILCACARPADGSNWRARWLHRHSCRMLRVFGVRLAVQGVIPECGFLVANHLSYLDILVLGACRPCVFVAKSEVRGWPVFGWFARLAGTVFVKRQSRLDSARAVAAMKRAESRGALVVLFPEGTSSDGAEVLPFKSSLLEPLVDEAVCGVAHLRYSLASGSVADEVCYWRDMTLVPHLLNVLTKDGLEAHVRFAVVPTHGMDRKQLAMALRERIKSLAGQQTESDVCAGESAITRLSAVCYAHVAGL